MCPGPGRKCLKKIFFFKKAVGYCLTSGIMLFKHLLFCYFPDTHSWWVIPSCDWLLVKSSQSSKNFPPGAFFKHCPLYLFDFFLKSLDKPILAFLIDITHIFIASLHSNFATSWPSLWTCSVLLFSIEESLWPFDFFLFFFFVSPAQQHYTSDGTGYH